MIQRIKKGNPRSIHAFSLVEVTIALGIVSYTLLGLLGLFVVGLNSSRDSKTETALAQIALHATSSYNGTLNEDGIVSYERAYSFEGTSLETPDDVSKHQHFTVKVGGKPSDGTVILNTGSNLHLITLSITSIANPDAPKVIQTSAYVP